MAIRFLPATVLLVAVFAVAPCAKAGFTTYFDDTTTWNGTADVAPADGLIDHDKVTPVMGEFGADNQGRAGTANSLAGYNSFIAALGLGLDYGVEDFEDKGRTGFAGVNPTGSTAGDISLQLRFDRLAPETGSLPITATLEGRGQIAKIDDDPNRNSAGRFPVSIPVDGVQYLDTNFNTLAFTITFDQPITAFGFFGTDVGDFNGQLAIDYTDINDVKTTVVIPHERSGVDNSTTTFLNASLMFFGFISDVPFTKVEFRNTAGPIDRFGFDNLVVAIAEVPAPASIVLLAGCLLTWSGCRRWRERWAPAAIRATL